MGSPYASMKTVLTCYFRTVELSVLQATPGKLQRRPASELSTAYPQPRTPRFFILNRYLSHNNSQAANSAKKNNTCPSWTSLFGRVCCLSLHDPQAHGQHFSAELLNHGRHQQQGRPILKKQLRLASLVPCSRINPKRGRQA